VELFDVGKRNVCGRGNRLEGTASLIALAVLCATCQAACHSGLRLGSAGTDASATQAGSLGTPKGFRIVNATASTVYVDLADPVQCRAQNAFGWQSCQFFASFCLPDCQSSLPGDQCCVLCEQATPTLLTVPPGGYRTIPWNGNLFATRSDYCSDCKCQAQSTVQQGTLEATVSAFDEFYCVWGQLCAEQADGTIPYAAPQNSPQDHAVQFAIPSTDDLVVVAIPAEPSVDQILANADALLNAQLTVTGKVLPDTRQRPASWPDPAQSLYLLQDSGDVAGYNADPPSPYIQIYSTSDLGAYLQQQVRVTARLRSVAIADTNGQSHPFAYLEILSIATN
jgi:hypothetical protein